jgi:uncharacterized protein YecE (DUF72 family)
MQSNIKIGTAGWTIPKLCAEAFPTAGSHLERYATRFNAAEINSSFYRPHKPITYARWASSVPPGFRFAVKVPREITHIRKLAAITEPLERFLSEVTALGDALGPLLVQLPPSLRYEAESVEPFFEAIRAHFSGDVVCEPRHLSWFADTVRSVLSKFQIARVAADPAAAPCAAEPSGWPGIVYRRLHGSPKMYYSAYSERDLKLTAEAMLETIEHTRESWCIFDNTALGAACKDALDLSRRLCSASPFGAP